MGEGNLSDTLTGILASLQRSHAFTDAVVGVYDLGSGQELARALTEPQVPRAAGSSAGHKVTQPFGLDTPFDLGSLTKPFTATLLLKLITDNPGGWLHGYRKFAMHPLDLPVRRVLDPWLEAKFGIRWKVRRSEHITFRHLLSHTSRLPEGADALKAEAKQIWRDDLQHHLFVDLWQALYQVPLADQVPLAGETGHLRYSDLGYMVLGQAIEAITGLPLDQAMGKHMLAPLGLADAVSYRPRRDAPPTWPAENMLGFPRDTKALSVGGVAGHASLFAPAWAVALLPWLYMHPGFLTPDLVQQARTPQTSGDGPRWGLGWRLADASPGREAAYSEFAFGHFGWPGTYVWADSRRGIAVVLLSNLVLLEPMGWSRDAQVARRADVYAAVNRAVANAFPPRELRRTQPLAIL